MAGTIAHCEGGLRVTDHNHDGQQRWSARLRAGRLAAAIAAALLAVVYAGSPAGASAPCSAAPADGYLLSNTTGRILKPGDGMIVRAWLNGTDVNQRFVARKDFANLHGIAVDLGR